MRLDHIAEAVSGHLFARLAWRTLLALIVAGCLITAFYQFTIAGLLALETYYGIQLARVVVGAVYTGLALIGLIAFWMHRRPDSTAAAANAMVLSRELRIIMLIEALMIGYGLARKGNRVASQD